MRDHANDFQNNWVAATIYTKYTEAVVESSTIIACNPKTLGTVWPRTVKITFLVDTNNLAAEEYEWWSKNLVIFDILLWLFNKILKERYKKHDISGPKNKFKLH